MNKHTIGNTDIEISGEGYGVAALFTKVILEKQGITQEKVYEPISTTNEYGVTFFDTGINRGYTEERLGR